MNDHFDKKQAALQIAHWHKAFGIDHLFIDIHSIKHERKIQAQNTPPSFASIDEIRTAIMELDCNLRKTARNTVFSDGPQGADIMIIGEAPGQEEDEQGLPFVGQSGQLLNNMLRSVGFLRKNVYISNIVFWRPPGNRTPSSDEISICLPFVEQHIVLAKPKALLLLGSVALKALISDKASITSLRGKTLSCLGIPTIATFHPAYLLRSPGQKANAFKDFISLKKYVDI